MERKEDCILLPNTPSWEISPVDLDNSFTLIDIRESEEISKDPYLRGPYQHLAMSQFDLTQLDRSLKYALFCQRGRRSAQLVKTLRAHCDNVYSVIGGIEALRDT